MQRISNESWVPIDERKKVQLKRDWAVSDDMTEILARKCNDINKAVKNSCKCDKKLWIETKCQEAEHAAVKGDARSPYKIVADLTESRPNTSVPINRKAEAILLSQEEENSREVERFSKS